MPPFAGPTRPAQPPIARSPRSFTLPQSGREPRLPAPPRFEPVINPAIVLLGIVGLLVLGGLAVIVFSLNFP
jgi:hypothetical protein